LYCYEQGNKGKNKEEKNKRHGEFNMVRRTMCMSTSMTTL